MVWKALPTVVCHQSVRTQYAVHEVLRALPSLSNLQNNQKFLCVGCNGRWRERNGKERKGKAVVITKGLKRKWLTIVIDNNESQISVKNQPFWEPSVLLSNIFCEEASGATSRASTTEHWPVDLKSATHKCHLFSSRSFIFRIHNTAYFSPFSFKFSRIKCSSARAKRTKKQ